MSKSPWGNIGAWAADAEAEELEQASRAAAVSATGAGDSRSFPSLKEAAVNTKQTKKTKMTLHEFTMQNKYVAGGGGGGAASRLTADEMFRLPTGPKERSPEEMQYDRLGGGFSNYGTRNMGPSSGRARDREPGSEGSWGGGGNRRSYGGFEDDRTGPPSRVSDFDQPSRADEVDNWSSSKKPLPQSFDSGSARPNRYGLLGDGGGISKADGDDNWGASKKLIAPPIGRSSTFGSGFRDSSRPEPDRWARDGSQGRQRLVLESRTTALGSDNVSDASAKENKPNPFGAARPREEVLADKGLDWKKLDLEIDAKKGGISRPTSSHSSRPGSSQSNRSEGGAALQGMVEGAAKPRTKVNPFGDAKPREVLLEEKGLDWRKIDLEMEHRRVDRSETQEERKLKEEIEQLEKESLQSGDNQTSFQDMINQKKRDLDLLIHELDDKVRFIQKPTERPGSGSGRDVGLPERTPSQPAFYEEPNAGELQERPRSRGGDAWARQSDPVERPRSRGGIDARTKPNEQVDRPRSRGSIDAWARPNEQVERPRSYGGGDAWTRPSDERRGPQGGGGGFFGSQDTDRPRSSNRW